MKLRRPLHWFTRVNPKIVAIIIGCVGLICTIWFICLLLFVPPTDSIPVWIVYVILLAFFNFQEEFCKYLTIFLCSEYENLIKVRDRLANVIKKNVLKILFSAINVFACFSWLYGNFKVRKYTDFKLCKFACSKQEEKFNKNLL